MPFARQLWLNCNDAAGYSATSDDVELLLEFLEAPKSFRERTTAQLQRRLDQQRSISPMARRSIPCHRPLGLHVLMPWPLAAWLAGALELSEQNVHELRDRFVDWLAGTTQTICCATGSVGVKGK